MEALNVRVINLICIILLIFIPLFSDEFEEFIQILFLAALATYPYGAAAIHSCSSPAERSAKGRTATLATSASRGLALRSVQRNRL